MKKKRNVTLDQQISKRDLCVYIHQVSGNQCFFSITAQDFLIIHMTYLSYFFMKRPGEENLSIT